VLDDELPTIYTLALKELYGFLPPGPYPDVPPLDLGARLPRNAAGRDIAALRYSKTAYVFALYTTAPDSPSVLVRLTLEDQSGALRCDDQVSLAPDARQLIPVSDPDGFPLLLIPARGGPQGEASRIQAVDPFAALMNPVDLLTAGPAAAYGIRAAAASPAHTGVCYILTAALDRRERQPWKLYRTRVNRLLGLASFPVQTLSQALDNGILTPADPGLPGSFPDIFAELKGGTLLGG
jgi:hypothetical protein